MTAKARAVRILDRYVWKELVTPFCLGLLVFTFLLLIDRIFDLTDLIINKGVPVHLVLMMLVYISPAILVLTIPIGFLLAILVAFGRLSADMEVVALKACGVSPLRLLWPVVVFGLGVTAMTAYLMIDAVPKSNYAFKSLVFEIVRTQATVGLKERVFNDTFGNFVIYVDEIAADQVALRNVFVSDERKPEEQRFITAREGRLLSDEVNRRVTLRLLDGAIHETSPSALQKYRRGALPALRHHARAGEPPAQAGRHAQGRPRDEPGGAADGDAERGQPQGQPEPVPGRDPQEVRDPGGVPRLQPSSGVPLGIRAHRGGRLGRLRGAPAHRALLLLRPDARREHRRLRADPAVAGDVGAQHHRGRRRASTCCARTSRSGRSRWRWSAGFWALAVQRSPAIDWARVGPSGVRCRAARGGAAAVSGELPARRGAAATVHRYAPSSPWARAADRSACRRRRGPPATLYAVLDDRVAVLGVNLRAASS